MPLQNSIPGHWASTMPSTYEYYWCPEDVICIDKMLGRVTARKIEGIITPVVAKMKAEVRSPGVEASLSQSEALYSDSLGSYTDTKDYSQHPYASQYYSSMQQAYGSQSYMQGSSFYNSAAAYGVLPQGYSSGGKLYSDRETEHTKTYYYHKVD
uniref:Uncharacterized protein n=1 Tax=Timema shepardi TaxID=629360 RepID=A0A7R9B0T2_TIMSH|nr:unnamed protein product [Timema shepardi]